MAADMDRPDLGVSPGLLVLDAAAALRLRGDDRRRLRADGRGINDHVPGIDGDGYLELVDREALLSEARRPSCLAFVQRNPRVDGEQTPLHYDRLKPGCPFRVWRHRTHPRALACAGSPLVRSPDGGDVRPRSPARGTPFRPRIVNPYCQRPPAITSGELQRVTGERG